MKPGSYVLKSIAAQLITKMVKRLIHIYNQEGKQITLELLGVTDSDIEKIRDVVK